MILLLPASYAANLAQVLILIGITRFSFLMIPQDP